MMKHFNTTFTYLGSEITISASVSDKYEDRDRFKAVVASDWMTHWLRDYGIFNIRCIHAQELKQVSKKETVKWAETVKQMEEAEKRFEALPNSTEKLVMAMYASRDAIKVQR